MSTIFSKIINRELPSYIIYEDDIVISFLDISQITYGHILVVCKKEYENIFDIDDNSLSHLITVVKKLSIKIKDTLGCKGVNIINNSGKGSGQTVFHFHIHIIPCYENEKINILFEQNNDKYSKNDFELLQTKLINTII